jgi:HSP20 family protein
LPGKTLHFEEELSLQPSQNSQNLALRLKLRSEAKERELAILESAFYLSSSRECFSLTEVSMSLIRKDPIKSITHWEPFHELERLQREMNHLFESWAPVGLSMAMANGFAPLAELNETDDAINLKLEIPGMEAKDLDIQVTGDTVIVKGERKTESKTEEDGVFHSEFRYGEFERTIALPGKVEAEAATAEYKDGILTLSLPKIEVAEKEAVKVNVG